MLESHPARSPGTFVGYIIIVSLVLLDAALLFLLFNEPISLLSFFWGATALISLPAVALVAYWTSALATARYTVQEECLSIEWGLSTSIVALDSIEAILPAQESQIHHFRGVRWPGLMHGKGQLVNDEAGERPVYVYATRPAPQQLLVCAREDAYVLSPADPDSFRSTLVEYRRDASKGEQALELAEPIFLTAAIWHNRAVQAMLLLAVLLNALLFAYLASRHATLPVTVTLDVDASGAVNRSGAPIRLFLLPLFGLLTLFINGVSGWFFYERRAEQPLAYFLFGMAAIVQIGAWSAVILLLG